PYLQRVDAGDVAARRAEDLERGDALPPRLEVRRDPAADTDPGDRQCGEADEREKLAHSADEPLGPGRGAVAGAGVEAGLGEGLDQRLLDGLGDVIAGEPDAGLGLVKRAGRGETRANGEIDRDDNRLAELEALAQPIRLLADDAADPQRLGADGE